MQSPNSNEAITRLLLDFIIDEGQIVDKNNNPIFIKPKMVSLLFHFKQNVPIAIAEASVSQNMVEASYLYFANNIVTYLNPHKKEDLIPKLKKLITDDNTISNEKKMSLLDEATTCKLYKFLADTFLYAINRQNKQTTINLSEEIQNEYTIAKDDIIHLESILAKYPPPEAQDVPEKIEIHELVYVNELLDAYADAENLEQLSKQSLLEYPKYNMNFQRQRKNYYAAETIRRSARDAFSESDINHFDVLKEETYDGIVDVCSQDYPHGFARLNGVMKHATILRIEKCLLSHIPNWIGNSEKKGVCHILVNDGRIKWVTKDE